MPGKSCVYQTLADEVVIIPVIASYAGAFFSDVRF
jgi:hypothetical protein